MGRRHILLVALALALALLAGFWLWGRGTPTRAPAGEVVSP